MTRRARIVPGMVTAVGPRLRIVNGDVESLRRLRKPGRPKKATPDPVPSTPEFPGRIELADHAVRDGFRLVRSYKREQAITEANRDLQARFEAQCGLVQAIDADKLDQHSQLLVAGKFGRVERSVPSSFCSCKAASHGEDALPCLIHRPKKGLASQWLYFDYS